MKRLILTSLFAAAASLGCGALAHAQDNCETADAAQMRTQAAAEQSGGNAIRLYGDQAERFLDYINDDVGRHTDYWGDSVIIGHFPALGYDAIAIVDDGCADETKLIRLNPRTTAAAMQAAESDSF